MSAAVSTPLGIIDAIILGIVEGITEYLPVSSTGHLVLTANLLGLDNPAEVRRNVDALLIVIQGGAILAVLGVYRSSVASMIMGLLGRNPRGRRLLINLFIAFLPAAILGPLLDDWISSRLMRPAPIMLALSLGGIVMILADRYDRKRRPQDNDRTGCDLSGRAALQIGLLQCLAMWPGTSRSMVTILGGMSAGLRPARAAEFAFLLGLPTLGGATIYKLTGNLMGEEPNMFQVLGWMPIVVGLLAATLSAALAVKWMVAYLNRHGLEVFGWYRLGLTAVLLALTLSGTISISPSAPAAPSEWDLEQKVQRVNGDAVALPFEPTRNSNG